MWYYKILCDTNLLGIKCDTHRLQTSISGPYALPTINSSGAAYSREPQCVMSGFVSLYTLLRPKSKQNNGHSQSTINTLKEESRWKQSEGMYYVVCHPFVTKNTRLWLLAMIVKGVKMWNCLAAEITQLTSLSQLKKSLLLCSYF